LMREPTTSYFSKTTRLPSGWSDEPCVEALVFDWAKRTGVDAIAVRTKSSSAPIRVLYGVCIVGEDYFVTSVSPLNRTPREFVFRMPLGLDVGIQAQSNLEPDRTVTSISSTFAVGDPIGIARGAVSEGREDRGTASFYI
jgi:hypothetical protein